MPAFYSETYRKRFKQMYVKKNKHLYIIKGEFDKVIESGEIDENGIVQKKKEKDYHISPETYKMALKIGKMQGKTDAQIWIELHKIEKDHGLDDEEYEEDVMKGNENYKKYEREMLDVAK